jgi:TolB-like protein/Flp pilus assembly protein TadD
LTDASRAIFISYASQDQASAARICQALQAAGLEVWFDRAELRGGDAWDQKIRGQIRDCALFMPVISANTATRHEGYFRLEWDLADQRTHMMARNRAFVVPVCIDNTREGGGDVPESFLRAQWTRLPDGQTPAEFARRVAQLLAPGAPAVPVTALPAAAAPPVNASPAPASRRSRTAGYVLAAVLVAALVAVVIYLRPGRAPPASPAAAVGRAPGTPPADAAVERKSIAVLPFVNLSSDKEQEYFADGLAEELLDLLAKTPGLHVVARTASFAFKGRSEDIATIAARLRVANILQGSVRKSGNHLRVTTQLVRAADGTPLWSETYDRELKDIFKVQDEIAAAVVSALKLKLAPGQEATASRSTNPDAYLQYILALQYFNQGDAPNYRRSVQTYRKAIALDPHYAAAYAGLSIALYYLGDATGESARIDESLEAAGRAVELAPDGPEGYAARGYVRATGSWDWQGALVDFKRALELNPNDLSTLRRYAATLGDLGRLPECVAVLQRALAIDPANGPVWRSLGSTYTSVGEFDQAREAIQRYLALEPGNMQGLIVLGQNELAARRAADALAAFEKISVVEGDAVGWRETGIAMAQHSLGHKAESQRSLDKAIAEAAASSAYQIAEVYAWRGETELAFQWLERAYRQRDGGLSGLKTDALMGSLRADPRYAQMLRKVNLPP